MSDANEVPRPDLSKGIAANTLADGATLLGRVADDDVLLVRSGTELFAVGAHCTHYHGPLADGLVVGDTVRCPWHHACFSLRTGEALHAPALRPVHCWAVERKGDLVRVTKQLPASPPPERSGAGDPKSVVIVGGGPAADA